MSLFNICFCSSGVRAKDIPSFDDKAIYICEVVQTCKPDRELTMQIQCCRLKPYDCGHAVCKHLAPKCIRLQLKHQDNMQNILNMLQGQAATFLACRLFMLRVPIMMNDNLKLYTRICYDLACGKRQ